MVVVLEMDESRVSFAESLRPPEGYSLSFAVGTTYTLDLRALLGLCIPLGLGFDSESIDSVNPVSLFAALQKLQNRLLVFCDKGHIHADVGKGGYATRLLMLLEGMIHQVNADTRSQDGLSSFHPKVWVVEYESNDGAQSIYRCMVMSRNLTFDSSWDAAVVFEGHVGEQNDFSNHLADFLLFLANGGTRVETERDDVRRRDSHTARIRALSKCVRNVEFMVDNKQFESADFLAFGPNGNLMDAQESPLIAGRYRNLLVMSPFLSDGINSPLVRFLHQRSGTSGRFVLLSREDSLAKLDDDLRNEYECYSPMPGLADVELDGGGGIDATRYSNLHAKVFFTEGADSRRDLYVGSLNASYNGTVNNVEAVLRLKVRKGYLSFENMLKPLIVSDATRHAPFAPYVHVNDCVEEDDGMHAFKRAFGAVAKLVVFKRVCARMDEEQTVSLEVNLELYASKHDGLALSLRPLLLEDWKDLSFDSKRHEQSMVFNDMQPSQVSGIFVLKCLDGIGHSAECVLVCPHQRFDDAQVALEVRSKLLLSDILSNHESYLSLYVAHAFGLPEAAYGASDSPSSHIYGDGKVSLRCLPGLYERLLNLADENPSIFGDAESLLDLVAYDTENQEIARLRSLIEVFDKAVC